MEQIKCKMKDEMRDETSIIKDEMEMEMGNEMTS